MKVYQYLRLLYKNIMPQLSHYKTVYFWDILRTCIYEIFVCKHAETIEYFIFLLRKIQTSRIRTPEFLGLRKRNI